MARIKFGEIALEAKLDTPERSEDRIARPETQTLGPSFAPIDLSPLEGRMEALERNHRNLQSELEANKMSQSVNSEELQALREKQAKIVIPDVKQTVIKQEMNGEQFHEALSELSKRLSDKQEMENDVLKKRCKDLEVDLRYMQKAYTYMGFGLIISLLMHLF